MGSRISSNCEICDLEEENIHMFLYCCKVQSCVDLVYRILFYFCNMNFKDHLLKLLFLEIPRVEKRIRNTICITMSSYISCIWYNRDNSEHLLNKLKSKIIREQKYHKLVLKGKIQDIFTENYCNIDMDILNNL